MPGESRERAGSLLVLAAAVLWGTTGTAQAFAPPGAEPEVVGAVRIALGGAALLAFATLRGGFRLPRRWPPVPTAAAALCIAGYQLCFFNGVALTGVAVGTIVAIGSAPVFSGVLGFVFRGERPGARWGLATVLAVLGCGLLVGAGGEVTVDAAGVLLALGAGLAYAGYATSSKRLLDTLPSTAVVGVTFALGGVLLSPLLVLGDTGWLTEPRGLAVALHLGLVATAAAYFLFGRGLASVPVATAATLSLAEPLTAGLLGVAVLGERLSAPAVAGSAMILGGLLLATAGSRRPGSIIPGRSKPDAR
jgi:DME family drug/metabolite transporter